MPGDLRDMASTLELIWWVLFIAAFGATIGSFANVLIHRIPRGSIATPVWSFCPQCEHRILFRDNIPIISFLLLRGRCRHCGTPISPRYPLVEAATIIAFLLVFDALCITPNVRPDLVDPAAYGVSDRVLDAWPMLLAHLLLVAGLIVISVIDLEEYWVDLRAVGALFLIGLLCHAVWTPQRADAWQPPDAHLAAVAFAAALGLCIAQLVYAFLPQRNALDLEGVSDESAGPPNGSPDAGSVEEPERPPDGATAPAEVLSGARTLDLPSMGPPTLAVQPGESGVRTPPAGAVEPSETAAAASPPTVARPPRSHAPAGWMIALLVLACLVVVVGGELSGARGTGFEYRSTYLFGLLFVFQVIGSARRRDSDTAVVEAIEEERHSARATALGELLYLVPAMGMAILASFAVRNDWWGGFDWDKVYGISLGADWRPVAGLARALWGALLAGALGWGVRIVFTLLLGKEAFGLGDVYIMAAAGAITGWGVVSVGFFLAAFFALSGVILLIVVKRSRAIPFGPWLSLGIVATLISYGFVRSYLEGGFEGLSVGVPHLLGIGEK